jgi:hypothetical protein
LNDSIRVTIDSGINTHGEDVLMVLGKNSWVDHVSVLANLSGIDIDAGNNSSGPDFDVDLAGKIKLIREDIFVVGQSENKLNDELTVASDNCAVGAPICVLPSNAVVLLMKTNDIWLNLYFAISLDCDGIKVLSEKI